MAFLPQKTGEATNFGDFIEELQSAYGRTDLLRGFTADTALCSLENANILDELGYTYVFGLKANQEMLYEAAQVILLDKAQRYAPDAKTDRERAHGKQTRRLLWKTTELKDFETSVGQWYHLRETWLVRQETKYSNNPIEIEERYFITNSDPGMVVPQGSLAVVRSGPLAY